MATNLLLEGDDLEALLIRARAEGGPNVRITRAQKIRHGGVWGFFAKERFEVAVEIPEAARPSAPTRPDDARQRPSGPDRADRPAPPTRPTRPTRPETRTDAPTPGQVPQGVAALIDLLDGAAAAERPTRPQVRRTVAPEVARALEAAAQHPTPGAAAAGGLLDLVDRASAVERAAVRAGELIDVKPATISLPQAEPLGPSWPFDGRSRIGDASASASRRGGVRGQGGGSAPWPGTAHPGSLGAGGATGSNGPAQPAPVASPTGPDAGGPVRRFADVVQPEPYDLTEDDDVPQLPEALDLLRAVALTEDGLRGPGVSPVRPSTTRPEFTALLDQLGQAARPAPTTPAPAPAPAPMTDLIEPVTEEAPTEEPAVAVTVPSPRVPVRAAKPIRRKSPRTDSRMAARVAADRDTLRTLGVPEDWTRLLRAGDRFEEVLRMLAPMPDADIHPDAPVIAVVGPASFVRLEACRTAVDLAIQDQPRPVVSVPAEIGDQRTAATSRALRNQPVVVAVETDGRDAGVIQDTLAAVRADVVVAVVDATVPLDVTQRRLDALDRVDALTLEGGFAVADPASVLRLGLPVIRFDGIPLDRVTWAALLCAQLVASDPTTKAPAVEPADTHATEE